MLEGATSSGFSSQLETLPCTPVEAQSSLLLFEYTCIHGLYVTNIKQGRLDRSLFRSLLPSVIMANYQGILPFLFRKLT